MNNANKIFKEYNLMELGLLPVNWDKQIIELANSNSYLVHLDGNSSTSREPKNSKGTDVFVVDGAAISEKINWLDKLYQNELLEFANKDFKKKYCISNSLTNGININCLKGRNSRYELHVDSNPLTGILYVTTHDKGEGGELVFKVGENEQIVYPQTGIFILFDAREIPHTVKPLRTDSFRISIPMNFYFQNEDQVRPPDLDNYIYKK